jgi:hypothetical protein
VSAKASAEQLPIKNVVLVHGAWADGSSWVRIVASNDRMIAPQQEIDSAKKMNARTITLPSSHVPMLSKPKDVAQLIIDATAGKAMPMPPGS